MVSKGGNKLEIHVISNGKLECEELTEVVAHIHPYITAIHLREQTKSAREIYSIIQSFVSKGVPLEKIIVNDRVDVAIASGVKGVQLSYRSLEVPLVKKHFPNLKIGKSVHSTEEALKAEKEGAHYLFYGHIFPTPAKKGLSPKGVASLRTLTKLVSIPVIAIGGIKVDNVADLRFAGAEGIAMMSPIWNATSPVKVAREFSKVAHHHVNKRSDQNEISHQWRHS